MKSDTLDSKFGMKMFAIAGDPVLHTRSHLMFGAAFDALRMNNFRYLRLSASRADEILLAMTELSISAFNVTSPFKEDVLPLLDDLDENARKIDAVNAICVEKGIFKGYNTDLIGVQRTFYKKGISLTDKKAVVLGVGGAAKAAVVALISEGADVVVINRTFERAVQLASSFSCKAAPLENVTKELTSADILVCCIPGGVDIVPDSAFRKGLVVLDANYGEKAVIARRSALHGCTAIDGMEWLIGQGLSAFSLFTGYTNPPVEAMQKAVSSNPPSGKSNIAIIGFMGAGKSVVACHLSKMMNLPLIDIDLEIEKRNGISIENIFNDLGEDIFRKMEVAEIERSTGLSGRIIACGGGAVLNSRAVDCLKQHCIVVWLWADIESILRRVSGDTGRPLLRGCSDRRSKIEAMLTARNPLYADASDIFIYTGDKTPEEIAKRIERESSQYIKN